MKKYKLKLSVVIDGKRRKKTMKQMSHEIYNHETNDESIKNGLYYIEKSLIGGSLKSQFISNIIYSKKFDITKIKKPSESLIKQLEVKKPT